ncbi:uncharacterized protein K441DRAFT_676514 [Cenococcum geophilum 1.58]|uniref:uncharacterized protein n=1 Tax=Cenococcum geophilum 1.58 TaxID=794803 RepID=UPI00358E7360|nr:hypothetical protein K441DRAFT_676514 [Cenococcum geophilum 1.58]
MEVVGMAVQVTAEGTAEEVMAAVASDRQPATLAADMGICQETVPKARSATIQVANHTTTQVEKLVISAETAHQRLQMSVSATNASSLATSRPHAPTSLLKSTALPTSATLRHSDTLEPLSLEEFCPRTFGTPHRRDNELRHPSLLVSWFHFAAITPLLLSPS